MMDASESTRLKSLPLHLPCQLVIISMVTSTLDLVTILSGSAGFLVECIQDSEGLILVRVVELFLSRIKNPHMILMDKKNIHLLMD